MLLSAEHLTCDLLEDRAWHLHETLPGGAGQVAILGGRRNVALNEKVAPFGQDRGRATAATAELGQFAFFSDDFMDFHNGY